VPEEQYIRDNSRNNGFVFGGRLFSPPISQHSKEDTKSSPEANLKIELLTTHTNLVFNVYETAKGQVADE
jgi:hypothetical protein